MSYMPFTENTYTVRKEILMFPDMYVCFAQLFEPDDATAVEEGGRKIIKAGTLWPANDATVRGIVFNDMDVTDGTASGAVLNQGHIRTNRLPAAPTTEAKAALKLVQFYDDYVAP